MSAAEGEVQTAQQAVADQQQVAAEAQSKLDAAVAAKTAADAALDQAKTDHASALTELADAQAKLSAAKDEKDAADKALDQAKAQKQQADQAVAQAQAKLDAAQATANASAENYRQGAVAFFRSVGADDAADIILNCKLAGYNKVGEEVDATSLTNMKQAVVWLKACNEYRASVGLGELKVTYATMATAIADANFSDTKVAHAQQFNVGENVAWNYGSNPFKQWVDQEKAYFDAAAASLGTTGLTGKAAFDFYMANEDKIDAYVLQHYGADRSVGHYVNVINPYYTVTGMGVCTRGTMNGWSTQAQTFTMSGRWYESYNANPMTVAEYEAALNAWCDSLANPEQGADAARNELAAAQGVAEDAGNKVNVASQAVAAKQAQVERATADVDAATAKASDARAAVERKQTAADAAVHAVSDARADLGAANAAVAAAQDAVAAKSGELDIAKGKAAAAKRALDAARTGVGEKQGALAAAQDELAAYSADIAAAQRAFDAASSALEDARANQCVAEAELLATQGDADQAGIDAVATQVELDMAQRAVSDADAVVATAQAKSDAAAARASQLKNAAAALAKATGDKATADAALDAAAMAVSDAEYDVVEADDAVADATVARDASATAVDRLRRINLADAIVNGSTDDADEALNAKIAAAHDAAERAATAKAELDAAVAAADAVAPAYLEALANYTAAKAELDQAIAELNAEIARQEAAERGNGEQAQTATRVTYQAKHAVATTEIATQQTAMPATGDASDLLGETFVIGGTVLVAAGVFLSDKRRQLTR